jgi:hypothetical protein
MSQACRFSGVSAMWMEYGAMPPCSLTDFQSQILFPPRLFGSGSFAGSPRMPSASSFVISLHGSGTDECGDEAGAGADELDSVFVDVEGELFFELHAVSKNASAMVGRRYRLYIFQLPQRKMRKV